MEEYYHMNDCIKRCVKFINDNVGFTVMGWYACGLINDYSIVGSTTGAGNAHNTGNNPDAQVDNGDIKFCPCLVVPINRELLHSTTVLYQLPGLLKYDLYNMNMGDANSV
eukprot:3187968-Ditylum_brightwellii.AAC.1